MTIRAATEDDLPKIRELLREGQLPTEGIEEFLDHFLVAVDDGSVVGTIGLEVYGEDALVRSFAVSAGSRDQGIGSRLFEASVLHGRRMGIRTFYLLTETAEASFRRKGFRICDRAEAPLSIQRTREFTELCPDSSLLMSRGSELQGG